MHARWFRFRVSTLDLRRGLPLPTFQFTLASCTYLVNLLKLTLFTCQNDLNMQKVTIILRLLLINAKVYEKLSGGTQSVKTISKTLSRAAERKY